MTAISELEREVTRILGRLRRLEEIPVQSVARLIKKSPEFVRANFPVIIHSPRSHHVRAVDVEAYQGRRTLKPLNEKKSSNNKRRIPKLTYRMRTHQSI